jgi:OOP family OmpA-OmpF porin
MIRKIMLASMLLAFVGTANAAEPKASGIYIGAGYGVSGFDDDNLASGQDLDDQDKMAQVWAGYKFNKYFGIEARYAGFGTFSTPDAELDSAAISGHVVATIPLGGSGFALFGNVGYGNVDFDVSDDEGSASETETAYILGAGVRWHITEMFSISVQHDRYAFEVDDFDETFSLAVGGTTLGIQIIF